MENTIRELIEILKEISPEIWSILIKQVYVEVLAKALWGITFAIGAYTSYKWLQAKLDDDLKWIAIVASASFSIVGFAFFLSALKWVIHPEFYALRYLLYQLQ